MLQEISLAEAEEHITDFRFQLELNHYATENLTMNVEFEHSTDYEFSFQAEAYPNSCGLALINQFEVFEDWNFDTILKAFRYIHDILIADEYGAIQVAILPNQTVMKNVLDELGYKEIFKYYNPRTGHTVYHYIYKL